MRALGMTIGVVLFLTILGAVAPHVQASHAGDLDCNNPSTFHNAYEYSGCFTEEEKRELWEKSIDSFELSRYRANLRQRFRFSSPTYDDVAVNSLLDFLEQNGYWYLTGPERRYFAVRFRSKPLMRHLLFLEGGSWQIPLDATPYVVDVVENFYRIGAQTDVDNPRETLAFAANFWVTLFDATEGVIAPTPKPAPGEFVQDRNGKKRFQELYPDRYEALYSLGFPISGVFDQPVFNRKRQDITKPQNQFWTDKELQFLQSGLKIADGRFAREPDADYREWIAGFDSIANFNLMIPGLATGFALNKQLAPLGLLFPFPCTYFKIKADGGHLRWANAEECQMMLLLAGGMIGGISLAGDYAESIGLNQTRAMMVAKMEREAAGDILGFTRGQRFSPYDLDAIFSHPEAATTYEIMRANYLNELTEVGYFVPTQIIRPTTALAPWVPRVDGSVGSELWRALWNRKKFAFDPEPWTQWLDGFWDKLSQTGVPERGVSAKSYRQALRVYRAIEGGETDPGVLTLMLDMDFPLVTLQDMASLATIRGNGIPTNLALATRSKLLSHPEALAAFEDLTLTVRSQPSEFYADAARRTNERGPLPPTLIASGKTVPELIDTFEHWFLERNRDLLPFDPRLHLGPELARAATRGVHPSRYRLPELVVEVNPQAFTHPDSPWNGKSPEEALVLVEGDFVTWETITPEGQTLAEFNEPALEVIDGTEGIERVIIYFSYADQNQPGVDQLLGIRQVDGAEIFRPELEGLVIDRNGDVPVAYFGQEVSQYRLQTGSLVGQVLNVALKKLRNGINRLVKGLEEEVDISTVFQRRNHPFEEIDTLGQIMHANIAMQRAAVAGVPDLNAAATRREWAQRFGARPAPGQETLGLQAMEEFAESAFAEGEYNIQVFSSALRALGTANEPRIKAMFQTLHSDHPRLGPKVSLMRDAAGTVTGIEILPHDLWELRQTLTVAQFADRVEGRTLVTLWEFDPQNRRGYRPVTRSINQWLQQLIFDPGIESRLGTDNQVSWGKNDESNLVEWLRHWYSGKERTYIPNNTLESVDNLLIRSIHFMQEQHLSMSDQLQGDLLSYFVRAEHRPEPFRLPDARSILSFFEPRVDVNIQGRTATLDLYRVFEQTFLEGPKYTPTEMRDIVRITGTSIEALVTDRFLHGRIDLNLTLSYLENFQIAPEPKPGEHFGACGIPTFEVVAGCSLLDLATEPIELLTPLSGGKIWLSGKNILATLRRGISVDQSVMHEFGHTVQAAGGQFNGDDAPALNRDWELTEALDEHVTKRRYQEVTGRNPRRGGSYQPYQDALEAAARVTKRNLGLTNDEVEERLTQAMAVRSRQIAEPYTFGQVSSLRQVLDNQLPLPSPREQGRAAPFYDGYTLPESGWQYIADGLKRVTKDNPGLPFELEVWLRSLGSIFTSTSNPNPNDSLVFNQVSWALIGNDDAY